MNLSAVILAGGESRRMGRDKAWVESNGQSLLAASIARLRQMGADEVFISGRPGVDYSVFLDCAVLTDREPGLGPLGGIERALLAATHPLLLVLAVDLPRMSTAFLQTLVGQSDAATGVVPQRGTELEPLAAIYPRRCHAVASACLAQRRFSARGFAEICLREHAVRAWPVAPTDEPCFANCNTLEELACVAGRCRPPPSPRRSGVFNLASRSGLAKKKPCASCFSRI